MKLVPKNWSEFQQYKDRKPQWIKFHRELLNDFAYSSVHINTKAVLPLLWLLACEYDDGVINASVEEIAFRIHIDKNTVNKAIEELIEAKFFTLVQDCTEVYKNVPREEKRREEKDTYTPFFLSDEQIDKIVTYRKSIKKPFKTNKGIKSIENSFKECIEYGYIFESIFELMISKEWQSIKLDWVKKELPVSTGGSSTTQGKLYTGDLYA